MKRVTLTALLAFAVIMISLAQPPRGGRGDGAGRGMMNPDELKKELNLTDAQATKLKTINEDFRSQMKEKKDSGREEVKTLREKHQTAIKEVLTPEQYEKMCKMRQEARQDKKRDKRN